MGGAHRYRLDPWHIRPEVSLLSHIDPVRSLGKKLLAAEKPSRYLGGEQGATHKDGDLFTIALCFPDLYEIGMSNNAIRILYNALNALPGVRCERVFAPAPDFEAILRDAKLPLYTLESGIPLCEADMLALSIGYELCATNILTVLDLGNIPLDVASRGAGSPIVMAGGPAITNPHPFSRFLDAVWIGEAEAGFFDLVGELAELKRKGADRSELLARLRSESPVWMPGKKAHRAIDANFSERLYDQSFPWPSVKPVQDHGTVEIMRGCPNGCRFCHAGYFYRPQRVRNPDRIFQEVEALVERGGYREITLSSLSSGDYPDLPSLIGELNRLWAPRKVSFQLPSLKVESFTLPIISELAQTRKSGLTFAVETPDEAWQRVINKNVTLEKIIAILDEARLSGYRLAKFYFMIGLPVPESEKTETESLASFLRELLKATSFQLNVNIGTFIPKPHTPFQWCPQIGEEEALSRINEIRSSFRSERRLKISYHSPFLSTLEGLFSRGDERVGDMILKAWEKGARLDSWEDYMRKDVWREAMAQSPCDLLAALDERSTDERLPWDDVSLNVSTAFLAHELENSRKAVTTPACIENCTNPCGVCRPKGAQVKKTILSLTTHRDELSKKETADSPERAMENREKTRLVFRFEKTGSASYLSHHAVLNLFYRTLQLAKIPVVFSEGFNPIPHIEIEEPIPLGMESLDDYFSAFLYDKIDDPLESVRALNSLMPAGIRIHEAREYSITPGVKTRSLSSLFWGSSYTLSGIPVDSSHALESALADPRLAGSSVRVANGEDGVTATLRLRAGRNREIGFGAIFKAAVGVAFHESPIVVRRLHQFADCGTGPMAYFQALDSIYGR